MGSVDLAVFVFELKKLRKLGKHPIKTPIKNLSIPLRA